MDDGRRVLAPVGFVDDHVAVVVERLVSRLLPGLIADDPGALLGGRGRETTLLHDEHEVAFLHVWLHAPALDGDHRRPDAADREQQESDSYHDSGATQHLADEHHHLVVAAAEPTDERERAGALLALAAVRPGLAFGPRAVGPCGVVGPPAGRGGPSVGPVLAGRVVVSGRTHRTHLTVPRLSIFRVRPRCDRDGTATVSNSYRSV